MATDNIAYVPFHDARKWQREGLRTRDAHVFRELVGGTLGARVLVLDRPTCVAELVKLKGRWRPRGRTIAQGYGWRLTESADGFRVGDVLLGDLGFSNASFHQWLFSAYGGSRYGARARALLSRLWPGESPILWLCHPFAGLLRRRVPHSRLVVDCFDNFSVHPEIRPSGRDAARQGYAELADTADAIVVNSDEMHEYLLREFKRDALTVPNGVCVGLFHGAPPMPLPDVERPLLGYAGKLGIRIDVDLLLLLADSLRAGTIVLAGQVLNQRWVGRLFDHPRIRHLGDLHYSRLPGFLAACDVCLVPHRVGAGENQGDATKIYEYLAAGKPVVSTAIAGVRKFAGRIAVAPDRASFVEAVRAVASGEMSLSGGVLQSETWSARVQAICDHLGVSWTTAPKIDR